MRGLGFIAVAGIWLVGAACAHKPAPAPAPPAPENVFALLPEPNGESTHGIVVRNQAGAQDVTQANQAVKVARVDAAPSAPYGLTDADVRRLFGPAIDSLPAPEVQFALHFELGSAALNAAVTAQMPAILKAIQDRHSTSITVTGHTDRTGKTDENVTLGMQRAQAVADILLANGVKKADLVVSSHGEVDPIVKTGPGEANEENRRVEVIVR